MILVALVALSSAESYKGNNEILQTAVTQTIYDNDEEEQV